MLVITSIICLLATRQLKTFYYIIGSYSDAADGGDLFSIIQKFQERHLWQPPGDPHRNNSIITENKLPGTPDWVLTNPAFHRQVEGYMSRTSIQRGEPILLYHNTKADKITVEVYRTGWYGGIGARRVLHRPEVKGISQANVLPDENNKVTCNWVDPFVIQTELDWVTGIYLVKMTEQQTKHESYAIFALRDDGDDDDNDDNGDHHNQMFCLFFLPIHIKHTTIGEENHYTDMAKRLAMIVPMHVQRMNRQHLVVVPGNI